VPIPGLVPSISQAPRAALLYLHGSDERQHAVADAMSELTKDALTGQRPRRSGTQRARKRRTAS